MSEEAKADEAPAVTWPVTLKLRHPVQFGSELVEELTFRKGRFGDLKGVKIGAEVELDKIMLIASRLCGQSLAVIERLDEEDAGEVSAIAMGFYARCLAGGKTP